MILPLSEIAVRKTQIIDALQGIKAGGGTDINEGLVMARDHFDSSRPGVVRRIVLMTDGHGGHPLRTAKDLKKQGVVIDVIGIGPSPAKVNEKLLKEVASFIQGELHYWFITDRRGLVDRYTQLAGKTKTGT